MLYLGEIRLDSHFSGRPDGGSGTRKFGSLFAVWKLSDSILN